MAQRGIRVLSLDGGGIKGVTSLQMLKHIMEEARRLEQASNNGSGASPDDSQKALKPCEYFDLIGGTSTGGLIALMLGRLEYTKPSRGTKSSARRYSAKKLPWLTRWDATYDSAVLESCIKEVIAKSSLNLDPDAPMKDESRRCKTFVVSTHLEENVSSSKVLRSYDPPSTELEYAFPGTIWEAGRATSAAPTFFKPIVLDGQSYNDGATIANNPISEAIDEAHRIWQAGNIDCIVSLGTGPEGEHTMHNATLEMLGAWGMWMCQKMLSRFLYFRIQLAFYSLHAMTGTERQHQRAQRNIDLYRGDSAADKSAEIYFRLNVVDERAKVGLDEYRVMRKLQELADEYMETDTAAIQAKQAIAAKLQEKHRAEQPFKPRRPGEGDFSRTMIVYEASSRKMQKKRIKVRCLIDTSTDHNFVAPDVLARLDMPESSLDHLGESVTFVPPTGAQFQVHQRVLLTFSPDGNRFFRAPCYLMEGLAADVILGRKSFSSFRASDTKTHSAML